MRLLTSLLAAASVFGAAVELTKDTFDGVVLTGGKNAFVKFLAPWWGHCKRMKPDWDKLGAEYAGSNSVVIADVDCTSDEGKPVCQDYDVTGYPTLKYFIKGEKHDYQGGRAFEQLKGFVENELAAVCSIEDLEESCSEKEQKYFNKMQDKGMDEVKKQHARLEKMKGKKMKPSLTKWLNERFDILTQMMASEDGKASEDDNTAEKEEL